MEWNKILFFIEVDLGDTGAIAWFLEPFGEKNDRNKTSLKKKSLIMFRVIVN